MLRTPPLALLVALALALLVPAGVAQAHPDRLGGHHGHGHGTGPNDVRVATASFRLLPVAAAAGYGLLQDAAGISCIDNPGVGAMGVHHVDGDLVGDGAIDALTPEALVYEPGRNGRLKLVAVEYVVFQEAWDAAHDGPPMLFGRHFHLMEAGNRYGLPAFYALHAWIWKHNPRGTFEDWNPRVHCPA